MYSLIVAVLYFSAFKLCTAANCKTPKGDNGVCVSIYNCTELYNALATFNDTQIKYVQKSQCGYEKKPLVCCPLKNTNDKMEKIQDPLMNRRYCGYQHFDDYVATNGTKKANINEFPWLANLIYLNYGDVITTDIACGGSLITERFVLTAAHCITPIPRTLIGIRLGEHNLDLERDCVENIDIEDCTEPVQEYGIEKSIIHPEYSARRKSNDIALIRLNRTVTYSDFIRPICLPFDGTSLARVGDEMVTTGWGQSSFAGKPVSVKKKVRVKLISNEDCKRLHIRKPYNITAFQNCMMVKNDNQDLSCQGDSGNPVMFANRNQWHVQGIVSFGPPCGIIGTADVNTNVASYLKWIVGTIKS